MYGVAKWLWDRRVRGEPRADVRFDDVDRAERCGGEDRFDSAAKPESRELSAATSSLESGSQVSTSTSRPSNRRRSRWCPATISSRHRIASPDPLPGGDRCLTKLVTASGGGTMSKISTRRTRVGGDHPGALPIGTLTNRTPDHAPRGGYGIGRAARRAVRRACPRLWAPRMAAAWGAAAATECACVATTGKVVENLHVPLLP
jgi:hypothetical protein